MRRVIRRGIVALAGGVLALTLAGPAGAAPGPAAAAAGPGCAWSGVWGQLRVNSGADKYMTVEGDPAGNNAQHIVLYSYLYAPVQQWQIVPTGDGYCYLRSATSWRVLGIADGSTQNSAHAMLWDQRTNDDQKWYTISGGAGASVKFVNKKADTGASKKCLGVAGGNFSNLAHLVLWTCSGANDQKWTMF